MTTSNQREQTPHSELEKSYTQIIQRAKEQQPGINDLLELYGQFQEGFKQSQEYLRLTQPRIHSSASNTSSC
jgi:hypothetical protein